MRTVLNKKRLAVLTIGIVLLLSVLVSFPVFISDFVQSPGEAPYSDAIVVLTGGIGRVEEGLRLFREGKGGFLIISGVEGSSKLNAIFPGRDLKSVVDTSKIILDVESRSTINNAVNVKKIAESRGFKSLTLVTSNYHIKRSSTIFRKAMKEDVAIYKHPVDGPNFRADRWWGDLNSIKLVLNEYFKYCWFQVWQRHF